MFEAMALRVPILLAVVAALLPVPSAWAADVVMSVDGTGAGPRVPKRMVGLSVETSLMPRLGRYASEGNLVELMRSAGPGLLRMGGNSGDVDTAFHDGTGRPPAWAQTTVGPRDLERLALLARRTGWRVIVTVGLGHPDPRTAARFARAAASALGRRLAGISIGNEPDDYVRKGLRPATWTFNEYAAEFRETADAVRAAVPEVRIVGPDNGLQPDWFQSAAQTLQPDLLGWHFYPLAGCGTKQTLGALLGLANRDAQIRTLAWLGNVGRETGARVRLTETNSVGCGGQTRVSDSQGSALWAVDLFVRAIEHGIVGINFHGGPGRCFAYSPLCTRDDTDAAAGRVRVRPLWYAMLLARQLQGNRLLPATVDAGSADVDATAFRKPDGGMHIVVVNRSARRVNVRIKVGRTATTGEVIKLRGASTLAKKGTTLGRRKVAADGTWRTGRLPTARVRRGIARVRVKAGTAALVRLSPRRGARIRRVLTAASATAASRRVARVRRVTASARGLRVRVACPPARAWCSARLTANAGARRVSATVAMRGGASATVPLRVPRRRARALARVRRVSMVLTDRGRHVKVRRPVRSAR
jgi:hypothetical protein